MLGHGSARERSHQLPPAMAPGMPGPGMPPPGMIGPGMPAPGMPAPGMPAAVGAPPPQTGGISFPMTVYVDGDNSSTLGNLGSPELPAGGASAGGGGPCAPIGPPPPTTTSFQPPGQWVWTWLNTTTPSPDDIGINVYQGQIGEDGMPCAPLPGATTSAGPSGPPGQWVWQWYNVTNLTTTQKANTGLEIVIRENGKPKNFQTTAAATAAPTTTPTTTAVPGGMGEITVVNHPLAAGGTPQPPPTNYIINYVTEPMQPPCPGCVGEPGLPPISQLPTAFEADAEAKGLIAQ